MGNITADEGPRLKPDTPANGATDIIRSRASFKHRRTFKLHTGWNDAVEIFLRTIDDENEGVFAVSEAGAATALPPDDYGAPADARLTKITAGGWADRREKRIHA